MKKIVHFAGDREVFNTVSIAGGVNFFAWEKDYNGECEFVADNIPSKRFLNKYDIIIQDNSALTILDKVLNSGKSNVGQMCFARNTFDLRSNFTEWDDVGVKVITAGRKEKFVNSDKFSDKNGIIGKYKVCTSKANGAAQEDKGDGKRVISDAFVIDPSEICNETYLVVNTFDSKRDAENFALFMKSKFFRFMMALRTPTQNISRNCFDWVPDMKDYSTVWTDKELYKEFGLGTQEQKYIERKIKAI
jgi:site-specific DNA-methyltransferase (adenine-specific)